jgi:hypothetical protein
MPRHAPVAGVPGGLQGRGMGLGFFYKEFTKTRILWEFNRIQQERGFAEVPLGGVRWPPKIDTFRVYSSKNIVWLIFILILRFIKDLFSTVVIPMEYMENFCSISSMIHRK